MRKKIILVASLLLTLGGCAQSPQQITLTPQIEINSHLSNQPSVHLSVVDKRPSKSLGTRGGTYRDSNHITLARNIQSMLIPAASAALTEMGISVDQPSPMPTDLQIWVEKLLYEVNDAQTLPLEIKLQVQIAAVANRGNKQQVSRYASNKLHKFLTPPNEKENEEIINEIISTTLTRLLNDPKLITLIQN
ncbi:MAG: putative lipoprotein [Motiliproteus sp.]|jgi:uncharacterized lipoprotein